MWRKVLWILPLLLVAGLLLFLRRNPARFLRIELKAIDAAAKARKYVVKQNADVARAHVELEHKQAIEELSYEQRTKADRLRGDPVRLAKFLVRAAGDS